MVAGSRLRLRLRTAEEETGAVQEGLKTVQLEVETMPVERQRLAQDANRFAKGSIGNSIGSSIAQPIISQDIQYLTLDVEHNVGSTGKGILIGMLSAFGSALLVTIILGLIYFLRYTSPGRILLDRMGRPGEYDDEQAFAKEEADALEEMDDIQRAEYLRAKAYVQANPPESAQTDISLSQFLAIQEKGVSAWEFEPELEIANCFVEGRTEIEFFDSVCSVQSNLPVPKQNDVYYWEAKIYDKPEATTIGIGMTTKPYPLFRLPGYHKTSVAYLSPGHRRLNQPFHPIPAYAPAYVRGDVVGCGYRPRTGTVFFTRNGKKLDDVTHALKTQNLFPTVGATGPCTVHVNFGQMGFVFIEANVKKWGLAPMTGSLAPPPPYGSEQGSILLEGGQHGVSEGQGWLGGWHSDGNHTRTRSAQVRAARQQPRSPGPQRSPTDISLAQLSLVDSTEGEEELDPGEGSAPRSLLAERMAAQGRGNGGEGLGLRLELDADAPPPEYESPSDEEDHIEFGTRANQGQQQERYRDDPEEEDGEYADDFADDGDNNSTPRPGTAVRITRDEPADEERRRLLAGKGAGRSSPPIPTYDAAIGGGATVGDGRGRDVR